jgi:hypothetical protein
MFTLATASRALIAILLMSPICAWCGAQSPTGGHVSMFELSDSLRLPHDIVDPDEATGNTKVTYPVILSLLYGSTPPANLGVRVIRSSP